MNENLDLTKILKDCPKGTKFYSSVYGKIEFIGIETLENNPDPITIKWFKDENTTYLEYLRADGTFRGLGECIIFPSEEQRDWSKWQRPFVKGDVVATESGSNVFIFNELIHGNCGRCFMGYDFSKDIIFEKGSYVFKRLATEEEKQLLFDAIKHYGYWWDSEKKELKKIEPKFDVSTLQAFDKVLVRDSDFNFWVNTTFGYIVEKETCFFTCERGTSWKQCIPYNEETKHLLGNSQQAPDKYITWE